MNRLEWILSGLLALLLIVVVVLAILFWGMRLGQGSALPGGSAAPTSEKTTHTARSAYEAARAVAGEWAADPQLLSANATWSAGTPFTPGEAGWGFQFYSAARESTALIAVSEGQVRVVRGAIAESALEPLGTEGWLVDSPQVIETILANGGQEFISSHGSASLTLTLSLVEQFQWQARLVDVESNEFLTMIIDPASGAGSVPQTPEGAQ